MSSGFALSVGAMAPFAIGQGGAAGSRLGRACIVVRMADSADPREPDSSAEVEDDPRDAQPSVTRQVSTAMVRLYVEQFGRGPRTVSTRYCGPDMIVSVLGDSLSAVELNLRDLGKAKEVRDVRMLFQHATEPKFRAAVEEITGRRVVGFMSGLDVTNDLSSEVFTLESEAS